MNLTTSSIYSLIAGNSFKIPHYQRPYAWSKKYMRQMINDFYEAFLEHKGKTNVDNYYFGQLILMKDQHFNIIVDGQQRLVSIYLLIKALCEICEDRGYKKELFSFITKYNLETKKMGVKLIYENQTINKCIKDIILRDKSEDYEDTQDEIIKKIYLNYTEISDFIEDKNMEFNEFTSYILNNVDFTIMTIDTLKNSLRIFNSMNRRGSHLRQIDLLKGKYCTDIQNDKKRIPKITEIFEFIDSNLSDNNKDHLLEYLYLSFNKAKELQKHKSKHNYNLYEVLHKKMSRYHNNRFDKSIECFSKDVKNYVKYINCEFKGDHLNVINQLKCLETGDWLIVYLTYFRKHDHNEKGILFLRNILKLLYRTYIKKEKNSAREKLLNNIVFRINTDLDFNEYIQDQLIYDHGEMSEAVLDIKYSSKKNSRFIRGLLLLIEIHENEDLENIDHILSKSSVELLYQSQDAKNYELGNCILIPRERCGWKGSFKHRQVYYKKYGGTFETVKDILEYETFTSKDSRRRQKKIKKLIFEILF